MFPHFKSWIEKVEQITLHCCDGSEFDAFVVLFSVLIFYILIGSYGISISFSFTPSFSSFSISRHIDTISFADRENRLSYARAVMV